MVSVATMMEVEPDGTLVVGDFEKIMEPGETCSIAGDYVTCTCDEEDSDEECCDCLDQSLPVCEGIKCMEAKMRNPSFGSMSNVSGMSGLLSPGLMSPMSLGFDSPVLKKKKKKSMSKALGKRATLSPCCPGCLYPSGGPVCTTCGRNIEGEESKASALSEPKPTGSVAFRETPGSSMLSLGRPTLAAATEAAESAIVAAHRVTTEGLSRTPTETAHRPTAVTTFRGIVTPTPDATSKASAGPAFRTTAGATAKETSGKIYSSRIGTLHKVIVDTTQASDVIASYTAVVPARIDRKLRKKDHGRCNLESVSSDVGLKRNLPKGGSKKKEQSIRKNKLESARNVTRINKSRCPVDNYAIPMVEREDTDEIVFEDSERSILNTGNGVIPGMSSKFGSASYAGYSFLGGSDLCGPRVSGPEGSKSAHQVLNAPDIMFETRIGRRQGHTVGGGSAADIADGTKLLLGGGSNSR